MEKLNRIEAFDETTPVDSPPPPYVSEDPNSTKRKSSKSKPADRNPIFITRLIRNLTKGKTRSETDHKPACKPLEFQYPDPTSVLCRCGKHNDTTVFSAGALSGKVRCTCGYIVESTGLSYYPSHTAAPPDMVMQNSALTNGFKYLICGCGEPLELPISLQAYGSCQKYDLTTPTPATPRRLSSSLAETEKILLCSCGKLVDLKVEYDIYHHEKHLTALRFLAVFAIGLLFIWQLMCPSSPNITNLKTHYTYTSATKSGLPLEPIPKRLQSIQDCSISNIQATDLTFLDLASPPSSSEFIDRRDRLAQALFEEGFDAFVIEPGYTFSYYANVTQKDWEVWEPEERPFLLVVQPERTSGINDNIEAKATFLVPSFEAERARLLNMPFKAPIEVVTYEEHWDPYTTLRSSSIFKQKTAPKLMVDEEMREFISRGLGRHFNVSGLTRAVEQVRQRKSEAEVGILRAVNTGTVECLRAMRSCLTPGLDENDVMIVLDNTLRAAGLDPFFDIVLFDEDASNPHGGTDGSKVLTNETMILIDVGAHLYGYSSDICRSFFPPFASKPASEQERQTLSASMKHKLHVWNIVMDAQTASLHALVENSTAAAVDIAARNIIETVDDGRYNGTFTHRVGHGIGIKAHESPYLNQGNTGSVLKAGMVFTSEPGIYLVNEFGVRHEDVLLVKQEGMPDILTGERAKGPWDP
ncbi:Hypothetical protein R9X50_00002100 [Acrodontium crateriforme]|uniref:Peptidase M24 domain-containing protein n=1 Tax=Acrodontium crateriforme TaxID=150365 RepID=A0AAQ3LWQ3_9PEZI|nr:Hypothetical protein R9X50_00002100 [Acrodontium crateriforme]